MLQELLPFFIWLLELVAVGLSVGGAWRTFERGGQRGWAALVPVYNLIVLGRVAQRREWTVLLLIPCVNLFVLCALCVALARRFGRGPAFGLGLVVLPFVCWPLLSAGWPVKAPAQGVA